MDRIEVGGDEFDERIDVFGGNLNFESISGFREWEGDGLTASTCRSK